MHHSISDLAMANDAGLQHGLAGVFRVMIPYVEHVKRVQDSLLVASARSVVMYILCACAATSVGAMAHAWVENAVVHNADCLHGSVLKC